MFVVMASGKCELHIYFSFLQEFNTPRIRNKLIFFRIKSVVMPNIHLSAVDNFKMTCQTNKFKRFFKITIRKRYVYIDIRWSGIWNQYFYLGIWNVNRTNITVLPSFQLATRLNSQNRNETEFIIEISHINLCMNIGISNWHNWNFDLT